MQHGAVPTHPSPRTRQGGFTLIELLVVIGIIAVLAGLLVPAVAIGMARARKARSEALLGSVQAGLSAYLALNSTYPETATADTTVIALQDLLPGTDHPMSAGQTATPSSETLAADEVLKNNRILLAALRSVDRDSFQDGARHIRNGLIIDDWEEPLIWRSYLRYPYWEGAAEVVNGQTPPNPDSYQLWSSGPDQTNTWGGGDDINNWGR